MAGDRYAGNFGSSVGGYEHHRDAEYHGVGALEELRVVLHGFERAVWIYC